MIHMTFSHPYTRIRRNKRYHWVREMFTENHILRSQLILPIFVTAGNSFELDSMPGISVLSINDCTEVAQQSYDKGIAAIILFPRIDQFLKDENGSYAIQKNNLICQAISAIKKAVPRIGIIADVALDPYTTHGHDGVLDAEDLVDNDKTVNILTKQALILADAGCDVVAPSDMMDGRVQAIRLALEENNFLHTQIFSYSAKYASKLYNPFRDAVGSKSCLGTNDKKHYQLNPANIREAARKVHLDIKEGADAIIVKPALFYLDIIKEISQSYPVPVIAYQVSGEYATIKNAAAQGIYSYEDIQKEFLLSCKRAGASCIITYSAIEIAKLLPK